MAMNGSGFPPDQGDERADPYREQELAEERCDQWGQDTGPSDCEEAYGKGQEWQWCDPCRRRHGLGPNLVACHACKRLVPRDETSGDDPRTPPWSKREDDPRWCSECD